MTTASHNNDDKTIKRLQDEFRLEHPMEYRLQIDEEKTDHAIQSVACQLKQLESAANRIGRLRLMLRAVEQDFMRRVFSENEEEEQDWFCYSYSFAHLDTLEQIDTEYLKDYDLSLLQLIGVARSIEGITGTLTHDEPTEDDLKWVDQQFVWPAFIRTAWHNVYHLYLKVFHESTVNKKEEKKETSSSSLFFSSIEKI